MLAFTKVFKPRPGQFSVSHVTEGVGIGTGGITVGNATTTSVHIGMPQSSRSDSKIVLLALNFTALAAAASTGTVTIQAFKRDNVATSPADRTLTATKSIKSDVITTTDKTYSLPITGTDAQATFFPGSGDTLRVDVVTSGTVSTQPQVVVTATFGIIY